jgi:N-acetylneuraminic acid mutarotase
MIAGTIGNQIIAAGGDYTITGGTTNRTISSNLSFAYSLENQTWSEADTMYCGHSAGTSATFNGKLYVFGGYTYNSSNRSNELTAVVECYDPDAEKWDSVCIMPEAFKGSAAVVFKNSIFILGGESQLSVSNSIYEFIPSSSSWVFAGRLMQPRSFHQAVLLNEEIYITGGWDGMGTIIKSTEVFTPGFTNTSSGSKMNRARCNFCAVEIDGRIYAFGGIDETGNVENGIELFDTKTSAWTVIGNMSNPVHAMAAVECHGKIMIIGGSTEGYSGFNESSIMEIYYP